MSRTRDDASLNVGARLTPRHVARTRRVVQTASMPTSTAWSDAATALTDALQLAAPPIAITFSDAAPDGVVPFDSPMPEPTADGRTGRVPAGCVFWTKAVDRTFTTVAAD